MHGYNKEDWLKLLILSRPSDLIENLPHWHNLASHSEKHTDIVDNIFCFASY